MNVLKPHLKTTVTTLLAMGTPQREIERKTGVDRKTIVRCGARWDRRRVWRQIPPRPPARASQRGKFPHPGHRPSGCAVGSSAEASGAGALGLLSRTGSGSKRRCAWGATPSAIYQELVDGSAFAHRYNSVKRFCRALRNREARAVRSA